MSFSIRQYALIFSLMTILLIAVFSWHTKNEFDITRQNIEQSQQQAAKKEIRHAIQNAFDKIESSIEKLRHWSELHQQLDEPTFFAYWYNHRLKQSITELQNFQSELMVYNRKGDALAKLADNPLPDHIDIKQIAPRLLQLTQQGELIYTLPIQSIKKPEHIVGYLSIKTDILKLIRDNSNFYYVNPETLAIVAPKTGTVINTLTLDHIRYKLTKPPEITFIEKQLRLSIIKLTLVIALPAFILYVLLVFIMATPLSQLNKYLKDLKTDTTQKSQKPYRHFFEVRELRKIYDSLYSYHNELHDTHVILNDKNKALWEQANRDPLTGVFNRRALDEQWEHLNELLSQHRVNVCFILFDVNVFKSINDTHGHQVGDEVLKGIAHCISSALRKGEHLYRIGGDEFASLLIDCEIKTAVDVAERCLHNINNYAFNEIGMPEPVRLSIGISQSSGDNPDEFSNLQWQADAAMYAAKRPGSVTDIVVFSDEMKENSRGLLSSWLNNTVYQAIDKGMGLELYYQPIINLESVSISYYEALVRIHIDGKVITPDNIFSVVETRHFEVEMDRAIIRRLCSDLEKGKIPSGTGVSLNISAPTLTRPQILKWLEPLANYTETHKVVIEVTETDLITEMKKVTEHLLQLRKMNFTIALDDFGSGYSSIRYLGSMPVDIVKFDITLIQTHNDPDKNRMLARLAQMISEAGYQLVAEGIEDESLMKMVHSIGFVFGQGYLFGRPELDPASNINIKYPELGANSMGHQLPLQINY